MSLSFLERYTTLSSPIHRLDARTKILLVGALVVICVSTPPRAYLAFASDFAFLLVALALSRIPPRYVFGRSLVIIPFVGMVALFVPFMHPPTTGGESGLGLGALPGARPGLVVLWNVLVKSYVATLSLILLSATTPFPCLLRGLEQLGFPRVLVLLASFAYRYLFVLVEEAERMKRARDSRCYGGRWLWHASVVGRMIGTLFLRSYERGERVYQAMLARGHDGRTRPLARAPLHPVECLCLAVAIGLLVLVRVSVP